MSKVFIVVEPDMSESLAQIVAAFKRAVLSESDLNLRPADVAVISRAELDVARLTTSDRVCPLTLSVPETLIFPAQTLYRLCRNVDQLRQRLAQWQYATGQGDLWLPIVLTAKGPLYAEVIGIARDASVPAEPSAVLSYQQPIHLTDEQRQPLYALAQRLVRSLDAPPAVYLMQFSWQEGAICFDRLLPFPAAPAIASLHVQVPDLFTCHWRCLIGKPIVDLTIH